MPPRSTRIRSHKSQAAAAPAPAVELGVFDQLSHYLPKPAYDDQGRIYCVLVGEYRGPTPEEVVRQGFILHLHGSLGYAFDQMRQEVKVQHGRRSPRADVVVYASVHDRAHKAAPAIVVECKAEAVDIQRPDYYQGESYARAVGCEFLVTHNQRQTAIFKLVPGTPGEAVQINDLPAAADWSDARRIEAIKNSTRAFSRREFQDLLFRCHCILRDVHKMEPGRAFDAISKVLFIKMYVERTGTWGTFTTEFLDQREKNRLPSEPPVHEHLFTETRRHYSADEIFSSEDRLDISGETFRRLVKELERFNLSATGDDVKGLAFEQFLGTTFRGELGMFFTPRPVVEFMVDLVNPREGELVCDPASGSGGFLIRVFEHIRNRIRADIQARKDQARTEIEALELPDDEEFRRIEEAFARLNRDLDPDADNPPSRVRKLAWDCVYGTDAEPRAARTSKMNMIMHGDGHGGIHYHDGLVDINGIFPGRFDVLLTNPPFGANVGADQFVGNSEETRVPNADTYLTRCAERYGDAWRESHARTEKAAKDQSRILDLFEIGKDKNNRPTELLFLERCIQLLTPGGRLGIVLPDGNLNNPSLAWLRRWAEGKARLLAVVSLPEETFASADATVKASLVFLHRFTAEEQAAWEAAWTAAHAALDPGFNADRDRLCAEYGPRLAAGDSAPHAALLAKLAKLGVRRALPAWRQGEPPPYPRGVGATAVGKPKWTGEPTDPNKIRARGLRRQFEDSWTPEMTQRADELLRELRAALRTVDEKHAAALWHEVRERFDYPVFSAAPETVGITSTGAEGPSQLPAVPSAYRRFDAWLQAGAAEDETPDLADTPSVPPQRLQEVSR